MDEAACLSVLVRSGAGAEPLRGLLAAHGGAAAALAAGPGAWRAQGFGEAAVARAAAPDAALRAHDAHWLARPGHRLVGWTSADYPELLRNMPCAPAALYVVGDVELLWHPQVAVVGSRRPSAGGRDHARVFGREFARAGVAVCSGLAEGVDAEAHVGALEAGRTVAVLGTGPDRCFPRANASLMQRIAAEGALVTEHPPGTPGIASHFPSRNRIIAGLSLGVLVVEAALRSGALITARLAAEAGREAFALPGSIHNPMARGCHRLIRQGATLAESAQDVLEGLVPVAEKLAEALRGRLAPEALPVRGPDPDWEAARARRVRPALPAPAPAPPPWVAAGLPRAEVARVWSALAHDPVNLDQLCRRTGLTLGPLSAMLLAMELEGSITVDQGRYSRRSTPPPAHRIAVQAKG